MEDLLFKKICRLAGNAVTEYGMIRDGDRILAGVSGGKTDDVYSWTPAQTKDVQ